MQLGLRPSDNAFDDFLYRSEVLELDNGQTEQAVDEALEREARELGITSVQQVNPSPTGPLPPSASTVTVASIHVRSGSSNSEASRSTGLTSRCSKDQQKPERTIPARPPMRRRFSRKSTFITEYENFLSHAQCQETLPLPIPRPPPTPTHSAPSVLSTTSGRSSSYLRRRFGRFSKTRKSQSDIEHIRSCVCCREDLNRDQTLHTLPCSHSYCEVCLHTLSLQAIQSESSMPPKCCSKPIPGIIIKAVLSRDEQQSFLKSVLQFATPWEDRVFCPNTDCGEFIPKKAKIDPKHPFEVVCKKCKAKACKTCRREAHAIGQDCPADWELDAVLQMGENQGWRRCYKCKTLVELSYGCTHMTCRCKAQFCYICGAVWDREVGCPNFCNGEEELERRRIDEENQRIAEVTKIEATNDAAAAARTAELYEAMQRSIDNEWLQGLRARQLNERDRFLDFEQKQRWLLWTRHGQEKADMRDRHAEAERTMKDEHLQKITALEDRQVNLEMELHQTLEAERRACSVRLRHMEAYCHSLNAKGSALGRVVTDRDLRELKQQYSVRDDMARLHESRINVLREKQAKQLETLVKRQEEELEGLIKAHSQERQHNADTAREEKEAFEAVVVERKARLMSRWAKAMEIARTKLERQDGVSYGPLLRMEWGPPLADELTDSEDNDDDGLGSPMPDMLGTPGRNTPDELLEQEDGLMARMGEDTTDQLSPFPRQGSIAGPMSQLERDAIMHAFPPGFV